MALRPVFVVLGYVLAGLVFVGIGIPLARRSIRPNLWYGFRTPKTLSSPDVWYAANHVAGIDLIVAGAAITVCALGLYVLHQTLIPSLSVWKWGLVVFVMALVAAAGHSFWYLSRI